MTTAFELGCLSAVKKAETQFIHDIYRASKNPHEVFDRNAEVTHLGKKIPPGDPSFKIFREYNFDGAGLPPYRGGIIDRGSQHIPTIKEPQLKFLGPEEAHHVLKYNKMPDPNQEIFDLYDAPKRHFRVTPNNLKELDRSSDQLQLQREYERGDEEFAQKQQAQKQQKQQKQPSSKSLLSHLKNPYVLGGLGVGALGLGGYAAYKAYQGSKKKKKPASE
jgi:hypothetical protein